MKRAAFVVALSVVYASAMRLTGQAPGGVGAQGTRSAAHDWTQDMAMKIAEPFALASVGDVIIVRPASRSTDPGLQSALKVIHDSDAGFGAAALVAAMSESMSAVLVSCSLATLTVVAATQTVVRGVRLQPDLHNDRGRYRSA